MPNSLPDYKRGALKKRRAVLLEEYEAINTQLGRALDAAEHLRLQRHLDDLERRIQEIDEEMEGKRVVHAQVTEQEARPEEIQTVKEPEIPPLPTKRDRWVNPKSSKEMVRVPAGEFLYGDKKEKIELPEFWIDRTPVTNTEYARFVAETGRKPPRHWKGMTPPEEIANHPVTFVSWHDVVAYAE